MTMPYSIRHCLSCWEKGPPLDNWSQHPWHTSCDRYTCSLYTSCHFYIHLWSIQYEGMEVWRHGGMKYGGTNTWRYENLDVCTCMTYHFLTVSTRCGFPEGVHKESVGYLLSVLKSFINPQGTPTPASLALGGRGGRGRTTPYIACAVIRYIIGTAFMVIFVTT